MVIFPWWSMSPGVTVATRPRDCVHGDSHHSEVISVTRRYRGDKTTWLCAWYRHFVMVISVTRRYQGEQTTWLHGDDHLVVVVSITRRYHDDQTTWHSDGHLVIDISITRRYHDDQTMVTVISPWWFLSPGVTMMTRPHVTVWGRARYLTVTSERGRNILFLWNLGGQSEVRARDLRLSKQAPLTTAPCIVQARRLKLCFHHVRKNNPWSAKLNN